MRKDHIERSDFDAGWMEKKHRRIWQKNNKPKQEEIIMNEHAMEMLEYAKIKERLGEFTISELGKALVVQLHPITDVELIKRWIRETTEARAIVERSASIPIQSLTGIEQGVRKLGKGTALHPEELDSIASLLKSGRRVKKFMEDKSILAPTVSAYAYSIYELSDVIQEIDRCIVNHQVDDKASPELSKIRKKIIILEERIKSRLESILKSPGYRAYIQENLVSMRNGRYVIPIKSEYRKNIEGHVLDSSSSGSTVFIEPAEVRKLQDELNVFQIEEQKEEYKVLSYLTGVLESYQRELSINIETMAHYDFIFAKAKYSKSLDGISGEVNTDRVIQIRGGKHPLLGKSAVPLDFAIGKGYRTLTITGPNTGGKTVALKTVGLLTMMVQSGLHVPAERGSSFSVFGDVLVDIGDGQSIEQSLSTFSSHITNIISIIDQANPYTLVILDELGAGTDPAEGVGIAVAVLDEIYHRGATTIATTHYNEIKAYAAEQEGFENGCMEFNLHTLKPLYRLKIGKAGESNAFLIALRLGMDRQLIEKAHEFTYKEKKDYTAVTFADHKAVDHKEENINNLPVYVPIESKKMQPEQENSLPKQLDFKLGDCVYISTINRTGIVCELENKRGEVAVMVMRKKIIVNRKRLSIVIDKKELYPDDYDFDIVFESKENRKKKRILSKRHEEGVVINHGFRHVKENN